MATLNAFLRSDELDDTITLAHQLNVQDADMDAIRDAVAAWTDEQAIANLLMYSYLLPDDMRVATLLRGLNQATNTYAVLAALVGLQDLELKLDEGMHTEILNRLIDIIHSAPQITQARATVILNQIARPEDADPLLRLLTHPDEVIRHNILVAFISAVGLQNASAIIEAALKRGTIVPATKAYADAKLAGSERFFKEGEVDYSAWYLSDLSAPLLTYIPNLKDFST